MPTCGSFTIQADPTFDPNLVFVDSCELQQSEGPAGETITIEATVKNNHDDFVAVATLDVTANGARLGGGKAELDPNETKTVAIDFPAPNTSGTIKTEVGSANKGTPQGGVESLSLFSEKMLPEVGSAASKQGCGCGEEGSTKTVTGRDRTKVPKTY